MGVSPDGRNVLGIDVVNGRIVRLSYPASQRIPVCNPPDDILPEISHQLTANTNKSWDSLVSTKLLCAHFRAVWTLLRKDRWMVQLLVIPSHSLKWQIFHTLNMENQQETISNKVWILYQWHLLFIYSKVNIYGFPWEQENEYFIHFTFDLSDITFPTWVQPPKSKNKMKAFM